MTDFLSSNRFSALADLSKKGKDRKLKDTVKMETEMKEDVVVKAEEAYLDAVSELSSENNVVFPTQVINAMAQKSWRWCHKKEIIDRGCYQCAIPTGDWEYNYENSIDDPQDKKEMYKRGILLPFKVNLTERKDLKKRTYQAIYDTKGEYWLWFFGVERNGEFTLACSYKNEVEEPDVFFVIEQRDNVYRLVKGEKFFDMFPLNVPLKRTFNGMPEEYQDWE